MAASVKRTRSKDQHKARLVTKKYHGRHCRRRARKS